MNTADTGKNTDIIKVGVLNGLPKGMDYTRRARRIYHLGNAIVWPIAYEIFKAIEQVEIANTMNYSVNIH